MPGPLHGNQGLHVNIAWGTGGALTPTGHPPNRINKYNRGIKPTGGPQTVPIDNS